MDMNDFITVAVKVAVFVVVCIIANAVSGKE